MTKTVIGFLCIGVAVAALCFGVYLVLADVWDAQKDPFFTPQYRRVYKVGTIIGGLVVCVIGILNLAF